MTKDEAIVELGITHVPEGYHNNEGIFFEGTVDIALDGLGLCGCSGDSVRYVVGLLSELDVPHPPYWSDGPREFFLNAMDRMGVVEHGTSVRRSWLTPRGMALLTLVREWQE